MKAKVILLVISLLNTCIALQAQFAGGTGTESDPWQITTFAQLNAMRDNPGTDNSPVFYKLMNDLVFTVSDDLNGDNAGNFDPISNFYGSFDGNGKTITGLVIEKNEDRVGLFGSIYYSSGYIRNLGLVNCRITGKSYVGGICGRANDIEVTACFVSGTVTATGDYAGGIAGSASSINACYNAATVASSNFSAKNIGGIAGSANYINTCYNIGSVSGNVVVGSGQSANCFALEGSGQIAAGSSVTLLSEAQMKAEAFLNLLNDSFFINYWKAGSGNGFPRLAWQDGGTIDRKGETAINPFSITSIQELDKMHDYVRMYRYFRLENDLNFGNDDYNGVEEGNFNPIGAGRIYGASVFYGELEGNNKRITGLKTEKEYNSGLFGAMKGAIRNLTLENADIKGDAYIGGFVGEIANGHIENCSFSGKVTGADNVFGCAGGIVGQMIGGNILRCTNTGTITGNRNVGGISGSGGVIEWCVNEGNITGLDGGGKIAGISGDGLQTYSEETGVIDCRNSGTVSAPGCKSVAGLAASPKKLRRSFNEGSVTGQEDVGGVFAGSMQTYDIVGCYNTGNVTGENAVGGVSGTMSERGYIYPTYWNTTGGAGGSYPSTIFSGCFNTGEVRGKQNVGGVAPGKYVSTGCFYIKGKVYSEDHRVIEVEEGAQGVTEEQMKSHVVIQAMNVAISNSFSEIDKCWYHVPGAYPTYYEPAGGNAPVYTVHLSVTPFGAPVEVDGIRFNTKSAGYLVPIVLPEGDYSVKLGDYADDTKQTFSVLPNNNNTFSLNSGIIRISDGNSGSIYQLSKPEHVHLMRYANSSKFELMNDIVFENAHDYSLTEGNFYPIWNFEGSLNGKGYAIRNLTIRGDSLNGVGLFQTISNSRSSGGNDYGFDSEIKNLRLENVNIKGRNNVGAIAGSATSGVRGNARIHTIDNCFVSGVISGVENVGGLCGITDYSVSNSVNGARVSGNKAVGGISGNANSDHTNNSNKGEITGLENTGGITGYAGDMISGNRNYANVSGIANTGGIAGSVGLGYVPGSDYTKSGKIENCFNAGEITASGANASAGGIAGSYRNISLGGSRGGKLMQSFNAGAVTASGANAYAGGLIGIAMSDTIQACGNAGAVTVKSATGAAGGLVGHHSGNAVVSAYNAGTVEAEEGSVGNLFGYVNNTGNQGRLAGMFSGVYYLQDENEGINQDIPPVGGWANEEALPGLPEAKTVSEMRLSGMIDLLNTVLSAPAWKADLTPNINNGFPILLWQTEEIQNNIKLVKQDVPFTIIYAQDGTISIDAEDFRRAVIYNISGMKMLETEQPDIYMLLFPQGVYIIQVQTGKGAGSQKLLIK